ncbi:hypothetical protein MRX96_025132 [Rhipicephalus microplus]
MSRVPLFLAVLSVALMTVGGYPSAFGYISSGFRSLADYKLATTAKLASFITGGGGGHETIIEKDDVVDPDEGGAELAAAEQPDVSVEPQELPIEGPASTDPVYDFKKQFAPGYAALDFANQLEKSRIAAHSRTTPKPQKFDSQVLPVPLEDYKDYVTGGNTGGSLMRVAVPEEQQQHQSQTQGSRNGPSSQSYSGEHHQAHIFPYGGWPTEGQLPGYVAYPYSSYPVADTAGSDSATEQVTGEDQATQLDTQHEGVIPGSQLPEHSNGTPDAEPVQETAEPTPASQVESGVPETTQGPRSRREADPEDEVVDVTGRPDGPEADQLRSGPLKDIKVLDLTECLAKVFCTMTARPGVFGPQSANVTEYLRSLDQGRNDPGMAFWMEASEAGSASQDCEALYYRCTLPAEQLKELIDSSYAL